MGQMGVGGIDVIDQQALEPVLRRWVELMLDDEWGNDDAPWWYNERATLSVFAGAVWTTDGSVFEEYSVRKGKGASAYQGRADIWFRVSTGQRFIAEAKQIWPCMGSRGKDPSERLLATMEDASRQVLEVPVPADEAPLTIVFLTPWLRKSELDVVETRFQTLLDLIREAVPDANLAWAYRSAETCPVNQRPNGRFAHPGVIAVVRKACDSNLTTHT